MGKPYVNEQPAEAGWWECGLYLFKQSLTT